jgi:transcription initiation factor TFIIIB Brf1 subunit/transcription initiation factor TFIIB
MEIEIRCPVCSSKQVYSLLNSLRCKRCGNIWKEEKKNKSNVVVCRNGFPINNQVRSKTTTDNIETKMEKKLDEYLKKFNGKFSLDKITWRIGDITLAMFRRYLKNCVKNKTLVEKKDGYGVLWYSRVSKK